jgi:hypothetical protein
VLSYFHIVTTYIKHGQRSLTEQSTSFLMSPLYSASLLSDTYVRNEAHLARPLFFPMSILCPRSCAHVRTLWNVVQTSARAVLLASSCRASLRGETRMCLMYYKTPFDFTYKVKVRTDKQSVGRSQNSKYFARRNICESFRGSRRDCAINLFEISMYRIRI